MCLGALYWARPSRIFFAATQQQAAAAGFDDSFIYREIQTPTGERAIPMIHVAEESAGRPFEAWAAKPDKTQY
jgi:guanine deaminase